MFIFSDRWWGYSFDWNYMVNMDSLCPKDEQPPYDDFYTNVTGA